MVIRQLQSVKIMVVYLGQYSVGGIIGYSENNIKIENCMNLGTCTGVDKNNSSNINDIGGIVGKNPNTELTIKNCYSIGNIQGMNRIAGIIALIDGGTPALPVNLTNCYWFKGSSAAVVASNDFSTAISKVNVTELNATQIKQQSSYEGFDFDTIWQINEGNGTPKLRNMPQL